MRLRVPRRGGEDHHGGHAASWDTLVKGASGSSYEVQSLRCPSGCAFRVRPIELRNLDDPYSKPSSIIRSKPLPRMPSEALRLELKLTKPPSMFGNDVRSEISTVTKSAAVDSVGSVGTQATTDLAAALGVGRNRVNVVEVRTTTRQAH